MVLNFVWASRLMIFMMVCSQYFIFTSTVDREIFVLKIIRALKFHGAKFS